MKRYLLLVMLCVCVSIGAWAAPTVNDDGGNKITVASDGAGSIADNIETVKGTGWPTYRCCLKITGAINQNDIDALKTWTDFGSQTNGATLAIDFSEATIVGDASISVSDIWKGVCLPTGSNLAGSYGSNVTFTLSFDSNSEISLYVSENSGMSDCVNVIQNKLYLLQYHNVTYSCGPNVDKESTQFTTGLAALQSAVQNGYTVTETSSAALTFEVEGEGIQAKLEAMDGYDAAIVEGLTITGNLSAADITYLQSLSNMATLDISGVTNAENVVVPSGVTNLTVPAGPTLPSDYSAATGLKYIYGVSSATVPQSVKILQGGGLTQAATDHAELKSGNVKIIGELTTDDIQFTTNDQGQKSVSHGFGDILTATSQKVVDLTEATFASPLDVTMIWQGDGDYCNNLTYVIPEPTKAQLNKLQHPGGWNANTYAYYDTDGHLNISTPTSAESLHLLEPYVNTEGRVVFQPRYNADGSIESYLDWNNSWWDAVNTYPAESMNFNFVNISTLGTDFSGLNSSVRYLIIPTATSTTAGVKYPDMDDEAHYKYSSGVYAVSTFKDAGEGYVNQVNYDGITYDAKASSGAENTQVTYVTSAGHDNLSEIAPLLQENMNNATRLNLLGTLTADDLAKLGTINISKVDLSHAHFASGVTYSDYASTNARYLLLPLGETGDLATAYNAYGLSTNCPNLLGVMEYDATTGTAQTHTTNADLDNGKSHVAILGDMLKFVQSTRTLSNLVMSGYLNDDDISTSLGLNVFTIPNYTQGEPTTQTYTDASGVEHSVTTYGDATDGLVADLSKAYFPTNTDMNFATAGWTTMLRAIDLPTYEGNKIIPANCFYNFKGLTNICIPYNYEKIQDGAFYVSTVKHITTTDANGAVIDNGDNTITLSANVKVIGKDDGSALDDNQVVFGSTTAAVISDVYVLATETPICSRGGFPAGMTYGWGGFDGGQIYCRQKYKNGAFLFTVLHYPAQTEGVSDANYEAMERKYTDITKQYTKKDQTGALDANGDPIAWPTFAELGRSWNQAIRGAIWYDWSINETDAKAGNVNGGTINSNASSLPSDVTTVATNGFDSKYTGWHEFVLTVATYVAPTETVTDGVVEREYKQGDWYTLCIPYNMTYDQVVNMLGVPKSTDKVKNKAPKNGKLQEVTSDWLPEIRQLKSVTRRENPNEIRFILSQKLETTHEYLQFNDDENIPRETSCGAVQTGEHKGETYYLLGGRPYLVKPYLREDVTTNNLGEYLLKTYTDDFYMEESCLNNSGCFEEVGGEITGKKSPFVKPYEKHHVRAAKYGEDSEYMSHANSKKYYYTFIGQFWQQDLPKYSFYMVNNKWYRYTNTSKQYKWERYKCIMMASQQIDGAKDGQFRKEEACVYPVEQAQDDKGGAVFKETLHIEFLDGLDDSIMSGDNMAKYVFVLDDDIVEIGEDSDVTAIMKLDGADITPMPENMKVYNVAGQYVGSSLEGLTKGLYIVNGKKIVVQ